MSFVTLNEDLVTFIHDTVLNPGELPGFALDKSLEAALMRVENRLTYNMIEDVYDLAAMYAVAVAQGHCFNDANKRTAHQTMDVCLDLNGIQVTWDAEEVASIIIKVAQGLMGESDLAAWLRRKADA